MLDVMSVSVLILNISLQLELDFINNQTKEKLQQTTKQQQQRNACSILLVCVWCLVW